MSEWKYWTKDDGGDAALQEIEQEIMRIDAVMEIITATERMGEVGGSGGKFEG